MSKTETERLLLSESSERLVLSEARSSDSTVIDLVAISPQLVTLWKRSFLNNHSIPSVLRTQAAFCRLYSIAESNFYNWVAAKTFSKASYAAVTSYLKTPDVLVTLSSLEQEFVDRCSMVCLRSVDIGRRRERAKSFSLIYPQDERKVAENRRTVNSNAFQTEFEAGQLTEGHWYLYSNGQRIAEADTEAALLALSECSAEHPFAFPALRNPEPVERGYLGLTPTKKTD